MRRAPILPANPADPTGVDRLERGAINDFASRIRRIRDAYIAGLNRIPAEPVVNKRYTFAIDAFLLSSVLDGAGREVEAQLLEGGEQNVWFFATYVSVAYQRGTGQQYANLARQSAAYAGGQQSLASVIRSTPYLNRIALIAASEFEEMRWLSGEIRANMARVLTDGIGRGINPREVAKNLTEQAGIEARRASRIARTEITTALRRARMDEIDYAADRYGLTSLEMHMSALSPTTRATHAARHATLHTTDEQREWWSQNGNSINCKCSTVSVLVGDDGKPLVPQIIERAKRNKEVMKAKGKGPWAKED
ncbi:phage minor head protein [Ectopseudomonas mendocina]|uniref:Phage minor head protein n=1 Tax=Ectopseudomonas mendocina TaxID=300 RepID=A0ABZ2RA87_ECTME